MPCMKRSRWSHLQVKQLCLGIPYDLKSPDGNELDEFMGRKEHPLARILRDLSHKETVRTSPFWPSAGSDVICPALGSLLLGQAPCLYREAELHWSPTHMMQHLTVLPSQWFVSIPCRTDSIYAEGILFS